MVHVGVQDGDAAKGVAQALRGDGGVVQVTEAAGGVAARMVAGRTADGVGVAVAGRDAVGAGNGALRRPCLLYTSRCV